MIDLVRVDEPGQKLRAWAPESHAEREAVREQLGRVLASSLFSHSKRFPNLLRYTVEFALENANSDSLKERILGVEVFGREPSYDTTQDPIVRVTSVEIRKRLAQYYQRPEHANELRITYPTGSYRPRFYIPVDESHEPAVSEAPSATDLPIEQGEQPNAAGLAGQRTVSRVAPWVGVACLLTCAVVLALWRPAPGQTAFDEFWYPVAKSNLPALLCIGKTDTAALGWPTGSGQYGRVPERLSVVGFLRQDSVIFTEAVTLATLASELNTLHKPYRIRRTESTQLQDLEDGPVIVIGGYSNPWTARLTDELRFTLAVENGVGYVRDKQNPSNRNWSHGGGSTPLADVKRVYGIISRVVHTAITGQPVISVAGRLFGTAAAGECLTETMCLEEARKIAPGDWRNKNIQIVVTSKVIGESAGKPQVVAAYVW